MSYRSDTQDPSAASLAPFLNHIHTLKNKSAKAKEKVIAVESIDSVLKDYVGNNEIHRELNRNSTQASNNNLVTWNTIFAEIEDYFNAETSRQGVADAKKHKAFDLVHIVVRQANRMYPHLDMKRVAIFLAEKFTKPGYVSSIGLGLLNMLNEFLSVKHYTSTIKSEPWKEFIKVLLKLYKNPNHAVSKDFIIETLNKIIVFASDYPVLLSILRDDVVKFFTTNLQNVQSSLPTKTKLIHGAVLLCRHNAVEFRKTLCKLGENIIPPMLTKSLHKMSFDEETDIILVELLLVQLKLHNPCDMAFNSPAFYANDIPIWISIIENIYSFCYDCIDNSVRRKNSGYHQNSAFTPELLLLAVRVTKHVSDNYKNSEDASGSSSEPAAKRQMCYKPFQSVISDVVGQAPSEGQLIWIQYIRGVIDAFPELVDGRLTFQSLFQMGISLLHSSFIARDEVYAYFVSLLRFENYMIKNEIVQERNPSWNVVWDITLKTNAKLGLNRANESIPHALELLRAIFTNVRLPNITSLLQLFVNGSLGVSKATLDLLSEFLKCCSIPQTMKDIRVTSNKIYGADPVITCPRVALVNWLLVSEPDKCIVESEIQKMATVLCALLIKRSHLLVQSVYPDEASFRITDSFKVPYEPFEVFLVKSSLVSLPHEVVETKVLKTGHGGMFVIQQEVATFLINILQEQVAGTVQVGKNVDDNLKKLALAQSRVGLFLQIVNVLEKYGVLCNDDFGVWFGTKVEELFVKSVTQYGSSVSEFVKVNAHSLGHIYSLVKILKLLLKSEDFCDRTKQLVAKYYPRNLVDLLLKVFRSGLTGCVTSKKVMVMPYAQDESDEDGAFARVNELKVLESSSLEALRCLMKYGGVCDDKANFYGEILDDLFLEEFINFNFFQFELCEELIHKIMPVLRAEKVLYTRVYDVLQKMCRVFFTNSDCVTKLWNLFADLAPIIATEQDENEAEILRRKLMRLVGPLSSRLLDLEVKISEAEAAFRMLSVLAKSDPLLSWSWFPKKNKPDGLWILLELSPSLHSSSNQIRMYAAGTICDVFQSSLYVPKGSQIELVKESIQKRKKLCSVFNANINQTFDVPDGTLDEARCDEQLNRTTLVLWSLTKLMFIYPFEQREVLFFLFMIVNTKSIDVALVDKALKHANPDVAKIMVSHISYLLDKWITLDYSLEMFPYVYFDCKNISEFYSRFVKDITLQYFKHNKIDALNEFAKKIQKSPQELVTGCYGIIKGHSAPAIAQLNIIKDSSTTIPKHILQGNDCYKRLIEMLGGKTMADTLMSTYVDDVLLNVVTLTFNPHITEQWGCPEILLPEPAPPFYDENSIQMGLNYLKETSFHQGLSVVGYLIQKSPKSVYKILLSLARKVHDSCDTFDKFWRLHQYSFFSNLLLSESKDILDPLKSFVCQFVVHSYLRLLLIDTDERFLKSVLHLLHNCSMKFTEVCLGEMHLHFRFIISRIVGVVTKCPSLKDDVRKILDFFFVSHGQDFSKGIISLDPFPNDDNFKEIFAEYKQIYNEKRYGSTAEPWSLLKELQICLQEMDVSKDILTLEKLKFLKQLLATRKSELHQLVRQLEHKRFLEECQQSVVHNILRVLVGTTMHAENDETIIEACRCLGEIGCPDLSVLVLPPFGRKSKITSMIIAVPSIIDSIACYLTNDDFETTVIAGEVLQGLLEVSECALAVKTEVKTGNKRLYSNLLPFMSSNPNARSSGDVNLTVLARKLELGDSNDNIDYPYWIVDLTCGLIDTIQPEGLAARLIPLCKRKVDFCEDILPFVVFYVLYSGRANPDVRSLITTYFQEFLRHFLAQMQNNFNHSSHTNLLAHVGKTASIYQNKLALRCLLGVVQFLRRHTAPEEIKEDRRLTPWDNNFWLDLNYLDLAKAAQYCGAYLTSVLYAEIYASRCSESESSLSANDEFYSQDTTSFPQSRNKAEQIEKLLLEAFSSIGEQDAIYGCGYSRLYDFQSNIQYLQQMKKWDRSLSMYDAYSSSPLGVCQSMQELGLFETLWTYMRGLEHLRENETDLSLTEIQFDCGWRLSKWDLHSDTASYVNEAASGKTHECARSQNKFFYESIRNGLSGDVFSHKDSLKSGFKTIANALRHASLESSVNMYGFLCGLNCLCTIEDFFNQNQNLKSVEDLGKKWKLQDQIGFSDFKFEEPVLYLRNVLLNSFREKNPSRPIDILFDESTHQLVCKAREAGRLELAEKCAIKFLESVSKIKKQVEIARNHCARGELNLACHLLKRVIAKTGREDKSYPSFLLLCGEWLFESKSDRPVVILEKYLIEASRILSTTPSSQKDLAKAYLTVAKYADAQYQNVCNYVKSDMFNEKAQQLQKAREEQLIADAAKREKDRDEDIKKSENILRKQSNLDQSEMNTTYLEKKHFLLIALSHYLRGLAYSNDHDLLIFRAIGLWLERADIAEDDVAKAANKIVVDTNLPSFKYIMVLHQLSARMGVNNAGINEAINNILLKCGVEHPYHTLPVLLTQSFLHKDKELRGNQKKQSEGSVQDRVKAALKLVQTLKKNKNLQPVINKMEHVWVALIELANVKELSNVEGMKKSMDDHTKLRKLKNIDCVPVPTTTVPIYINQPNQFQYSNNIIGIQSFDPIYQLVGGINSPRRISCIGTNGRAYSMLLKGHDDLRQDALMQQVFGVMNKLLRVEPRTKIRRLQVRTYKVVPLSQRSGIIEWCENTQTFGEYLVGSKKDAGAHCLYRPNDLKPTDCRRKMHEVKDCGNNEKKIEIFNFILENFKPVFRHFFFENFKDAGTYFERRLAYTRSVATSSMVGYILGLGDRHVLNILVDKTTAEFIHIDLGVAFEQGRILPTPEPIPFRLTRDVVDGMGVAGVEGVFRRSAEMTLEVLRNNSEIILTILEVLLYDPLYIWTLTADRMQKVQPTDSNKGLTKNPSFNQSSELTMPKERNNSAARVLLRLKQKLLGIEEGGTSGSSLSVPGQVSLLIQKAADPDLLSRIFPGWQPYL